MSIEKIKDAGLRLGLSSKTIKTYSFCVKKFLRSTRIRQKELKCITKFDVEQYLTDLAKNNRAGNTLNVHLNAIKFFFEKVLHRKLTTNISYSKVPKKLPEFLTQEEVTKLFGCIKNGKHLLMIKLLYSTGIRVSELVNLKVNDFQFEQSYGWVREGKGKKDRLFIIAQKLKDEIIAWMKKNDLGSSDWLFSGYSGHITTHTIRAIIKKAAKDAKITKNVHPHTLRHSFATHLIENGYAVTDVQPLLGHSKLETTMVYLHTAKARMLNVKSPFDTL